MSNDDTNDISSLYPPPPPYIKFFTKENLEKLPAYKKQIEDELKTTGDVSNGEKEEEITCALDFMIPPPMPKSSKYRAFGSVWQVKDELPDLETLGLTQLYKKANQYDTNNYQYKLQELRKLLKSLLLNYLELVGILGINPELYEKKVENIRTILVNIHHLLNEYRPHQSRESLIMLLEEQVEYKKKEIRHINQVCTQIRERLANIEDKK